MRATFFDCEQDVLALSRIGFILRVIFEFYDMRCPLTLGEAFGFEKIIFFNENTPDSKIIDFLEIEEMTNLVDLSFSFHFLSIFCGYWLSLTNYYIFWWLVDLKLVSQQIILMISCVKKGFYYEKGTFFMLTPLKRVVFIQNNCIYKS